MGINLDCSTEKILEQVAEHNGIKFADDIDAEALFECIKKVRENCPAAKDIVVVVGGVGSAKVSSKGMCDDIRNILAKPINEKPRQSKGDRIRKRQGWNKR